MENDILDFFHTHITKIVDFLSLYPFFFPTFGSPYVFPSLPLFISLFLFTLSFPSLFLSLPLSLLSSSLSLQIQ